MEKQRLLLGESKKLLISFMCVDDELGEAVGGDGGEDGDSGGADVKVGEVEICENSKADGVPESAVRRVERMRSKASFFQTTGVGEATIYSTTNLAMTDMSRSTVDCWRA
ncbi:unnamed protein product [Prunus brigantina]